MNLRKLIIFPLLACMLLWLVIETGFNHSPNLARSAPHQVIWPEISTQAWAGNFDRPVGITHAGDSSTGSSLWNNAEGFGSSKMVW
jgi:hypothetical protein